MIVAGTGHRVFDEDDSIVQLKARVKLQRGVKGQPVSRFICGMAPGFDLLAAAAAIELKIPVTAARPWTHHNAGDQWAGVYETVLDYADKIVVVTESDVYPGPACMHKRNHWMVNRADVVMAYWDGTESGGTFETIKYAKKHKKPIANIYNDPPF